MFRLWTAHIADLLSTEGDDRYLKAFQEQTIPDTKTRLPTYLPDRVRWSAIHTVDPFTSDRRLSEAQNQSPTRVTTSEQPIMVVPLLA